MPALEYARDGGAGGRVELRAGRIARLGPPPDDPDCSMDPALLAEFGFRKVPA